MGIGNHPVYGRWRNDCLMIKALQNELSPDKQQQFIAWIAEVRGQPVNFLSRWLPNPAALAANGVVVHPTVLDAIGVETRYWQAKWLGSVGYLCQPILKPIRGCPGHVDTRPRGNQDLDRQKQRKRESKSRPVSAEALLQNLHHSLRAVIGSVTGRSFNAAGDVLRKLATSSGI